MSNTLPIGVFDSGVGGLTVAAEIFRNLPGESLIYFGDTARVPYGNKSADTIIRYSAQIVNFLEKQPVKAIVVACNTASALALETIKKQTDTPIIGVVEPGARAALKQSATRHIGLIGTAGTVSSGLYASFISQLDSSAQVYAKACPLLVSLVEEGMINDYITDEIVRRYISSLVQDTDIDSLILGCTHYPLLYEVIKKEAEKLLEGTGRKITLINPAYETAVSLGELLKEKGLEAPAGTVPCHRYFVSDGADKFTELAHKLLGLKTDEVNTVYFE
ncbi:MAG: glutamate racemase [Parasporobacterium sp.]|nr:glutamate racemase [Parasporobacterium sp.]